jgi:hypothetical protein
MKVVVLSQTGAGSTSAIVTNTNTNPFNVGFGVLVTGVVDYTVQHTFDDPAIGFTDWFDHPTITGQIADADGNYAFPVTGIRLTVNSGAGTATLKLVQAGIA